MAKRIEEFSMQQTKNQRESDLEYYSLLDEYWNNSIGSNLDKLRAYTKYVPLGEFPRFLAKYEIFKKIINIHGSIVECGVHQGGGLLTWGILSSIFEPVNHVRKIFGFDTFKGFSSIHKKDMSSNELAKRGGLKSDSYEDINKAIKYFDMFRPLGHINKIELIKGNAIKTIPEFVKKTPHLVVSLLYLDFDVFEPTKIALKEFLPRMPKGSIVVFDELNNENWPGETLAVVETLGIKNIKIERFSFQPQISFAVI